MIAISTTTSIPLENGCNSIMKTGHDRWNRFKSLPRHTLHNNHGQTLVEYVLIIVVISLVVIAAMTILQGSISTYYKRAASSIPGNP